MKLRNLYVKSAKVQNCKTAGKRVQSEARFDSAERKQFRRMSKPKQFRKFLKNNCLNIWLIQEKFVPLQHSS